MNELVIFMTIQKYALKSLSLLALLVVSIMVMGSQQLIASQQGQQGQQDRVILPRFVTQEQTFPADSGNGLFFKPPTYFDVFNGCVQISTTKATLDEYKGRSVLTGQATILPHMPFKLNTGHISQLQNESNTPMSVSFNNYYYDLFGNINVSDVGVDFTPDGVIPLYDTARYGFAIIVNETEPLALSLKISEAISPTIDFDFWALSDNFENSATFSRTVTVGVESFIPLLFPRSGKYIIIFTPDEFSLLSSLRIYRDIPTYDFTTGIAETIAGTESMIKFYKVSAGNTPKAFRFFLERKAYDHVLDTSQYNRQIDVNYLGMLDITYYSLIKPGVSSMFPFGLDLALASAAGNLVYADSDNPVYIAIVSEPPNDNDPSVRIIKQDLNLSNGYKFQYSLWAESQPVPPLPLGTSFVVIPPFPSASTNLYTYSITEDKVISINSSSAVHADFYRLKDLKYYKLDPSIHDVLNDAYASLLILPPGDYIVILHEGDYLYLTDFPITTLDSPDLTRDLTANTTHEFESRLKQPLILRLPVDQIHGERVTIDYLDQANWSVGIDISWYDLQGDVFFTTRSSYEFIGNDVDPEWSVLKSSLFTLDYNVEEFFLRINQFSNVFFNTSVTNPKGVPVLDQNNSSLVSHFRITRQNRDAYLNATESDTEIFSLPLTNISIPFLNQTKGVSTALFTLRGEQKAYRIIGLATNFSIYKVRYVTNLASSSFSPHIDRVTIDGTTYEKFELEIAVDEPGQYGLIVEFRPFLSPNNGTFSLDVEELPIHGFPPLALTEIPLVPYPPPSSYTKQSEEQGILEWIKANTLLSGGVALALLTLIGGTILYKKRKA